MKTLFVLIFMFCFTTQFEAQEWLLKGTITAAEDKVPLPGANVVVEGTSKGVIADFDRKFEIKVKSNDVLVFAYLGYVTKKVTIKNQKLIAVALETDYQSLDEVVVVGYGVQRKSYITSSVSSVKAHSLSKSEIKRRKQKTYHNQLAGQI